MNAKLKKVLYVGSSVLVVFVGSLMVLPFAFKDKINGVAKDKINNMLKAKVDYADVDISFLRSFPNVSVKLEDFRIVGVDAFRKDTLVRAEDIDLTLNLSSLFSDKGYEVKELRFTNPVIFAHVLPDGKANWDVMKEDTAEQAAPDTTTTNFNLKLQSFEIKNASITYWDEQGKMKAELKGLNHTTSGDLTADSSLLVTKSSLDSLSFWMDGVKYLSGASAHIDADIKANMKDMIFTVSHNSSSLNAIEFSLDGWLKMLDEGMDMDLKLNTEKVDFKSILSLVPAIYATDFEGLKAGGQAKLEGWMKGKMVGDHYPAFRFGLQAIEGWFQYPSLPQKMEHINVLASVTNPGKDVDATVVDITNFAFVMAGNPFKASMHLATPVSDPDMLLKAVGRLDLSKVKDFYPIEEGTQLNGLFDMNMEMAGKMSYYETNQYDKFRFAGSMGIRSLKLKMAALPQEVGISKAAMTFNNRYIDLSVLDMTIGRNDLHANGKLENFVAYALKDKTLKGSLNLQSNYFNASDFMTASSEQAAADTTKMSLVVIPKNIDFTMTADFKQLLYDKMNFTNAKGALFVQNGDLTFHNMGMEAFGGSMNMNGVYSTTDPQKPAVKMNLGVNDVFFTEVFKQVDMLQKMAPIFSKATGKFSTTFSFNSMLKQDMTPDLATIFGGGTLNTKSVGLTNVPVLTALASGLKVSALNPAAVKDLSLMFEIKDGRVTTKPFNVNVADVKMTLGGYSSFDKAIAYSGVVNVPARFNVGGRLSTVNVKIGGTYDKPKVQLDLASTVNAMVKEATDKVKAQIVQQVDNAKAKAIEAAKAKAEQLKASARQAGDQLVAEAQRKSDDLVAKAGNPITKRLAQATGQKMVDEARRKANDLNAKAEEESQVLINKASGN